MRRSILFHLVVAAAAFAFPVVGSFAATAGTGGKIQLRVLYVGHPKSAREKDFVEFLETHFTRVGVGDLKEFDENRAKDFDVVILDYDGDGFDSPQPNIGHMYNRATVTVGVTGAQIGDRLGLKTGYL